MVIDEYMICFLKYIIDWFLYRPDKQGLVAVVVPNSDSLSKVTAYQDTEDKSSLELVESELTERLAQELAGELVKYEIPCALHLTRDGPWTPDTGLVTATMKIKRQAVLEKFQQAISNMFNRIN